MHSHHIWHSICDCEVADLFKTMPDHWTYLIFTHTGGYFCGLLLFWLLSYWPTVSEP